MRFPKVVRVCENARRFGFSSVRFGKRVRSLAEVAQEFDFPRAFVEFRGSFRGLHTAFRKRTQEF